MDIYNLQTFIDCICAQKVQNIEAWIGNTDFYHHYWLWVHNFKQALIFTDIYKIQKIARADPLMI